jgi:hypothetical protein
VLLWNSTFDKVGSAQWCFERFYPEPRGLSPLGLTWGLNSKVLPLVMASWIAGEGFVMPDVPKGGLH